MASKIDIFNMALSHIGITSTVADELERSPERITCSRFFDTCRDALLSYKDMDWNFARTRVVLADIGNPPDGWSYQYRYPNDCINALAIEFPGMRYPAERNRIPFQIVYEASGRAILTDQPEATLLYVKRLVEVERYPSPFVEALALRLAAQIAMPLGKSQSMRSELLQLAEQAIQVAMASSLNEQQPDPEQSSVYITEMHA